jgi:hypothetical protein
MKGVWFSQKGGLVLSRFCNVVILLLALFPTSSVAFTTEVEDAKSIARLYSAAFDRIPEVDGLNFWVESYESGRSLVDIAKDFYRSPEFTTKYGTLSDQKYVEQLYLNVLGRPGEQGGVDFWIGHRSGGVSRAKVMANFADSPENVSKTSEAYRDMRYEDGYWVFGADALPKLRLYRPGDSILFEGEIEFTEWDPPCCPIIFGPATVIMRWDILESSLTFENENLLVLRWTLTIPSLSIEEVFEDHFYQTEDGAWFTLVDSDGNYVFDTANERYGGLTVPSPLIADTSDFVQFSILNGDNTSQPLSEMRLDWTIDSRRLESIPLGAIEIFPVSMQSHELYLTHYDSMSPGDYGQSDDIYWVSPTKGVVKIVENYREYTSSGSLTLLGQMEVTATWSNF